MRAFRASQGPEFRAAEAARKRVARAEKRTAEQLDRDALASALSEAKRLRAAVARVTQERDDLRAELQAERSSSAPSLAKLLFEVRQAL
jgi:hypothetical protein